MTSFEIQHISENKNAGIAREHDLCAYYGIERNKHDSSDFMHDSDINVDNLHISVKAKHFTLMSGTYSTRNNLNTFEEIWEYYKTNTHSNVFAYVTQNYEVYLMNIDVFEQFVHLFCSLERESERNGGGLKIRCRSESKHLLNWLSEN